jgi:hypothetical protein
LLNRRSFSFLLAFIRVIRGLNVLGCGEAALGNPRFVHENICSRQAGEIFANLDGKSVSLAPRTFPARFFCSSQTRNHRIQTLTGKRKIML